MQAQIEIQDRNDLIAAHMDAARRVARKMARRVPSQVSRDDLEAAAMLGLAEAAARYDRSKGEPFFPFAIKRVRGAVLDELRRLDDMSRRDRRAARALAAARRSLEARLGRAANSNELAGEVGMSAAEVDELASRVHATAQQVELDDNLAAPGDDARHGAVNRIHAERCRAALDLALASLSVRDRDVLQMYYGESMSLKEIGDRLGVSESRVCQLRTRAEKALRSALPANDQV